eukprot:29357-Rhodomonas_salina.3
MALETYKLLAAYEGARRFLSRSLARSLARSAEMRCGPGVRGSNAACWGGRRCDSEAPREPDGAAGGGEEARGGAPGPLPGPRLCPEGRLPSPGPSPVLYVRPCAIVCAALLRCGCDGGGRVRCARGARSEERGARS